MAARRVHKAQSIVFVSIPRPHPLEVCGVCAHAENEVNDAVAVTRLCTIKFVFFSILSFPQSVVVRRT